MYVKGVLIFAYILLILVLWNNIHILYTSKNDIRNCGLDSTYVHFSKVDKINYLWFPKLVFTQPTYFKLDAGESLFITNNWFYWVKTTLPTSAVNFWFGKHHICHHKPFVYKSSNNISLNSIMSEPSSIWKSDYSNEVRHDIVEIFLNSNSDNEYIITLDSFGVGDNNSHLKKFLSYIYNHHISLVTYHMILIYGCHLANMTLVCIMMITQEYCKL